MDRVAASLSGYGQCLARVREMTTPQRLVGAASLAVALIDDPAVAQRWAEPSALTGYSVGGLAGHLARAVETVARYLDAPPPVDVELVDAAGYAVAVLGDHDPLTSDFHAAVRARGEQGAVDGPVNLAASTRQTIEALAARPFDLDRRITVLDGVAIALGDYLDTRLVEIVIHSDDLAVSVGLPTPDFDVETWATVEQVLAETARRRHGPRAVALANARPARHASCGAFETSPSRVAGGRGPTSPAAEG